MLKVLILQKNRRNLNILELTTNKSVVPPSFLIQSVICADSKTRDSNRAINNNNKGFFSPLDICFHRLSIQNLDKL